MNVLRGEMTRLIATRLLTWALLLAALSGGGLSGLLAVIGPENAQPPMPGLHTLEGSASSSGSARSCCSSRP